MISTIRAGQYTIRGLSLGGVHTSLHVPELGAVFDCGVAPRTFASASRLFLSHGHADHAGALITMLGIRGLQRQPEPLELFMPEQICDQVMTFVRAAEVLQRYEFPINVVPMVAGREIKVHHNLWVRGVATFHPVPSLGYQFFRRVNKLRPAFQGLSGPEIAQRRRDGTADELFECREHPEIAYVTDTLARVLHTDPDLLRSRVLMLECTFLDDKKSLEATHAGCHIHLDELIEMADSFDNERIVLMHFSQLYSPPEVRQILSARLPDVLRDRVIALVPEAPTWPG